MTDQQIFDLLSENEMNLFYAKCQAPESEVLKAAHSAARQALIEFGKITGCHN